jgi:hypothetical protein
VVSELCASTEQDHRADVDTTNSGGERSSQEDEPGFLIEDGGRYRAEDHHGPPEMVRHRWERRNLKAPIRRYSQHSTGQRTSREAASAAATR